MKNTKNIKKERKEVIIDSSGRTLGRVASEVAMSLMGKTQPSFERNKYSGIPGGLRILTGTHTAKTKGYKELIKLATYDMLPSNKLRRTMMKNLKIED